MNNELYERIISCWESIEAGEPDISTERLIAMTADYAGVDMDVVIDCMAHKAEEDEKK